MRNVTRALAALTVVLGVIGCSIGATETDEIVEAGEDVPFRLRVGETARVGVDGLLIVFRRVDGDSRCASDVTCVWSGDATVHIEVTVGRAAWTPSRLHTNVEPRVVDFRDYRITLVDLEPYPISTRTIAPGEYIATLEVERAR